MHPPGFSVRLKSPWSLFFQIGLTNDVRESRNVFPICLKNVQKAFEMTFFICFSLSVDLK